MRSPELPDWRAGADLSRSDQWRIYKAVVGGRHLDDAAAAGPGASRRGARPRSLGVLDCPPRGLRCEWAQGTVRPARSDHRGRAPAARRRWLGAGCRVGRGRGSQRARSTTAAVWWSSWRSSTSPGTRSQRRTSTSPRRRLPGATAGRRRHPDRCLSAACHFPPLPERRRHLPRRAGIVRPHVRAAQSPPATRRSAPSRSATVASARYTQARVVRSVSPSRWRTPRATRR